MQNYLNRIDPLLPAHAYKTYSVLMPLATHWRPGTCEEAHCPDWTYGWQTIVDEASELGQRQAAYIRRDRTRSCTEDRDAAGLTVFTFAAGQTCFTSEPTGPGHKVPLMRDARYLVQGGDWRGNPRGVAPRLHVRAEDWAEDFALHQQMIADRIKEG